MRIGTRSFDTAQDRLPTAGNSKQIAVFGYALSLMLFASSVPAAAQQSGKVHRIGFLMSSSTAETTAFIEAFRQGMRELGYLDGKNFVLEIRGGGANLDRLTNLAAELVRLEVDVIVAGGGSATRAAKKATNTIPVVIRTGADPVKAGLVDSLARPGGNITGLASINDELSGKRLEVLLELVPRIKRVAILAGRDRDRFSTTTESEQIAAAARALGVNLQVLQALDPNSIDNAFLAMSKERAEGLVVIPITSYFQHRKLIIEQAAKNRLAAIYPHSIWVENGGLISYGADFRDENRHLAIYVDKILKGAKPADLPVEQPTKFELVINLKAAKQIGLTIPPHVLARAEKVIRRSNHIAVKERLSAVITTSVPSLSVHRQQIADLALKNQLPLMSESVTVVEAGGLASYDAHRHKTRRAAFYVDKILKGAKPADLPVERATKFELVINLNTAKQSV